MKFQNILITGGSRGIGRSLVNQFLKDNCEVHVVSRNFKNKPKNPNLLFHSFDLSKTKGISKFCEDFILNYGVPDLLINNAGSGAFYDWVNFPESEIVDQLNLLFLSPVLFCRKFVPSMVEEGRGMIVNISSLATLYPLPYMPLYNAGKSALSAYTKSMIIEFDNPKFLDVILGDVKTGFNDQASKLAQESWSKKMKSAWYQIKRQLDGSPDSGVIASRLIIQMKKFESKIVYEGSFSHRKLFVWIYRILPNVLVKKILQYRYFNSWYT
jgi:short-subunit dehydrogenase